MTLSDPVPDAPQPEIQPPTPPQPDIDPAGTPPELPQTDPGDGGDTTRPYGAD